jgi:hypothetical protein
MHVANSWFDFTSVTCILVYEKELYQDVQGFFLAHLHEYPSTGRHVSSKLVRTLTIRLISLPYAMGSIGI